MAAGRTLRVPRAAPSPASLRAQERLLQTVPAYFWAGQPIFDTHVITDYVPASAVWDAADRLMGLEREATMPLMRAPKESPEVVLAFAYDQMRSDLVSRAPEFSRFKSMLAGAPSSLEVPYVLAESSLAAGPATSHRVCCSQAASYLESSGMLSNGESELVLINVGSPSEENDQRIVDLVQLVDEATAGRYAAVLTANKTVPSDLVLEFAPKMGGASNRRRLNYADTQMRQIPLTPDILMGLLVGGLLLIIFINGFCCLFQLQTPKKFETE